MVLETLRHHKLSQRPPSASLALPLSNSSAMSSPSAVSPSTPARSRRRGVGHADIVHQRAPLRRPCQVESMRATIKNSSYALLP